MGEWMNAIGNRTSVELLKYVNREYPGMFSLGVAFNPYEPEDHEMEKTQRKIDAFPGDHQDLEGTPETTRTAGYMVRSRRPWGESAAECKILRLCPSPIRLRPQHPSRLGAR